MTGEIENNGRCPVCGGRLRPGVATIPFVFPDTVVVIKGVPADICHNCHEPYMTGRVTDRVTHLLNQLRAFRAEVSLITYAEPQPDLAPMARVNVA
jgi:YgiT-type zinc finger domain-containing protein